MKSYQLALALALVLASGCGNKTAATADMAVAADMLVLSSCGHPGDTGNSLGVGKFCVTIADCSGPGMTTNICSALGNGSKPSPDDTYFCTIYPCTMDGGAMQQCGENATCVCASGGGGSGCACTPNSCLGNPDGGK